MDYIKGIVCDYKNKGIIVDTNLLILFIVGVYDLSYLDKCHRVKEKKYTEDDFCFVSNLLSLFAKIYVTPHVLAEISNLSFKDFNDKAFLKYFDYFLEIISKVSEQHVAKEILLVTQIFKRFGFADASIFELATKEDLPVITDDLKLHHYLINNGIKSINMDSIRATIWLDK